MADTPNGSEQFDRAIRADERSGVLHPRNLHRFNARWVTPAGSVIPVVAQYWQVAWQLDPAESIDQRIIEFPAVTLSIEEGDVPAPLMVTGMQSRAWTRTIRGSGTVFALRLQPAGLSVLSDLSPADIADTATRVTSKLDSRLYGLMSSIAAQPTTNGRVQVANELITKAIDDRSPSAECLLANAVVAELADSVRSRTGPPLAGHFGVSERSMQRALKNSLGRGPKWISRRIRVQEVARVLAAHDGKGLSDLAVELGYTDQAHLINDFRRVAGVAPGGYLRALRELAGQ